MSANYDLNDEYNRIMRTATEKILETHVPKPKR